MSVKKEADRRLNICKECEHLSERFMKCKICGCFLKLKVFVPNATCPIERW